MYYENLYSKVSPIIKHYRTDLTNHDQRDLQGYKGRFLHGARDTGTDLFLMDQVLNEVKKVKQGQNTDYFTAKGLRGLLGDDRELINGFYPVLALTTDRNTLYHYGEKGRIKQVSKDQMQGILDSFIREVSILTESIKQDPEFIYSLIEKTYLKEQQDKRERWLTNQVQYK